MDQVRANPPHSLRMHAAVAELEALVKDHYPTATFAVVPAADEPGAIHIIATVDLDDPDEVADLVMDRMLTLQIDEGLPVFVIPIRTPERLAAMLARQESEERSWIA
ncbi:MAG: hypothetical protein AB7R89_34750 [Dehalococcoidia bacterium]